MTAREMVPAIGAVVLVSVGVGDLVVSCRVKDVKTAWNQVRLLVSPVVGKGEAWVELSRLRRDTVSASVAPSGWESVEGGAR